MRARESFPEPAKLWRAFFEMGKKSQKKRKKVAFVRKDVLVEVETDSIKAQKQSLQTEILQLETRGVS
jgi:hypothetical protein